jgi:dimethylamine/trimethylamine dehydrogenase
VHLQPIPVEGNLPVLTPDDLMAGVAPPRNLIVFDDDHNYMANVLAEVALAKGCRVTYVTPAPQVAPWTINTMEQHRIQRRLIEGGVEILTKQALSAVGPGGVTLTCQYTGREQHLECEGVLMVTARLPNDALFHELRRDAGALERAGIGSVTALADALAPSTVQAAVYDGHRYAREIEEPVDPDKAPFKREMAMVFAS